MLIQKTVYPIYMYKANTEAPKIIANKEEENTAIADGWSTAYVHYEYPKWITLEDGSTIIVRSEEEHTAIKLAEDKDEDEDEDEDSLDEDEDELD